MDKLNHKRTLHAVKSNKITNTKNIKRCIITTKKAAAKNSLLQDQDEDAQVFVFEDLDKALIVATPCRLTLIELIRENQPESLYELARMVQKNQAYIYREAKILKECGLIEFEQTQESGRKKVRPISLFDEILLWF
jgi:predicted transcriptional regulator